MDPRRTVRFFLLAVVALGSGGCSWIFVDGPPEDHAELDFFTCTTSRTAPRLDLVWGGLNLLGVIVATAETSEEFEADSDGLSREGFIVSSAIWTVVAGLSARSGFQRVDACEEAIRQRGQRSLPSAPESAGDQPEVRSDPAGGGPGPVRHLPVPSWSPPLFPAPARTAGR